MGDPSVSGTGERRSPQPGGGISSFCGAGKLLLLVAAVALQACGGAEKKDGAGSGGVPNWVRRTPIDESGRYVYGVGYSPPAFFRKDTVENAKNAARVELAKVMRVVVKEELTDFMVGSRRSNGSRDELVSISESVLDAVLEGSQIMEVWHDTAGAVGERSAIYALARAKHAGLKVKMKQEAGRSGDR